MIDIMKEAWSAAEFLDIPIQTDINCTYQSRLSTTVRSNHEIQTWIEIITQIVDAHEVRHLQKVSIKVGKTVVLTITCMIEPWRKDRSLSYVWFSGASFFGLIVVFFSFLTSMKKLELCRITWAELSRWESLKMGKSAHFSESLWKPEPI